MRKQLFAMLVIFVAQICTGYAYAAPGPPLADDNAIEYTIQMVSAPVAIVCEDAPAAAPVLAIAADVVVQHGYAWDGSCPAPALTVIYLPRSNTHDRLCRAADESTTTRSDQFTSRRARDGLSCPASR